MNVENIEFVIHILSNPILTKEDKIIILVLILNLSAHHPAKYVETKFPTATRTNNVPATS